MFSTLCLLSSCCDAADDYKRNAVGNRPSKVRGANLPQEYELVRFVENISNWDPSWTSSTPACDWTGVSCYNSQVRYIRWSYRKLGGSLQWKYLCDTTREFRAWRNELTGSVPLDVLPSEMKAIDISSNGLSGKMNLSHLPDAMVTQFLYLVGTFC